MERKTTDSLRWMAALLVVCVLGFGCEKGEKKNAVAEQSDDAGAATKEVNEPCQQLYPRVFERDPKMQYMRVRMERKPTQAELEEYLGLLIYNTFEFGVHNVPDPMDFSGRQSGKRDSIKVFVHSSECFDEDSSPESICCHVMVKRGVLPIDQRVEWMKCADE